LLPCLAHRRLSAMFCAATRPHLLSAHRSAPIAPRWSRSSGCKNAHRGVARSCRAASRPTRSQVLIASGENSGCTTKARRTPLLSEGSQSEDPPETVTIQSNQMVPCSQLQAATDTIGPLIDAANRAFADNPLTPRDLIWPFSAWRGSRIHSAFAAQARSFGPLYSAEVTYKNGVLVPYATKGGVRADAVVGPLNAPLYVVELKSGLSYPTPAETANYMANLPPGTGVCAIAEALD
jgi:hypothetical protein